MELHPPLHFSIVVIEKGAFRSPSTKVASFIFFSVHNLIFFGILDKAIGLMSRVFTNGLEDRRSIPGRVILKTQKMVLNASLLNIQRYNVRIRGKVE